MLDFTVFYIIPLNIRLRVKISGILAERKKNIGYYLGEGRCSSSQLTVINYFDINIIINIY